MSEEKPIKIFNPHPLEYRPMGRPPFHGPWETMSNSEIEELAFFGPPKPEQESGQEVFGPLHDMTLSEWQDMQELARSRHELRRIQRDAEALIRVAEMNLELEEDEAGGQYEIDTPILDENNKRD